MLQKTGILADFGALSATEFIMFQLIGCFPWITLFRENLELFILNYSQTIWIFVYNIKHI